MLSFKSLYKKGCSLSMVKTGVYEVNSGAKMPQAFLRAIGQSGNRAIGQSGNYTHLLKIVSITY
jgi:hypothetical protein